MTKLERLAAACKGSMTLEANPHRDAYYKSAREWFAHGMDHHQPDEEGPPPEEMAAIEAGATLWWLQWYPNTPNGFNRLFGSNLDRMLDAALKDMGVVDWLPQWCSACSGGLTLPGSPLCQNCTELVDRTAGVHRRPLRIGSME